MSECRKDKITKESKENSNILIDFNQNDKYPFITIASKINNYIQQIEPPISIIELNLSQKEIDNLIEAIFNFKLNESEIKSILRPKSFSQMEAFGLFMSLYITFVSAKEIKFSNLWANVYDTLTPFIQKEFFIFSNKYPNKFLKNSIEKALKKFNLRNTLENDKEHNFRNSIFLQFAMPDDFKEIKNIVSNYLSRVSVNYLLNKDLDLYSNSFANAWKLLSRYRDNLIEKEIAKNILLENVWFKYRDIETLLKEIKESRVKVKKGIISTNENFDEVKNFYIDKIFYEERELKFIIKLQDSYLLNLSADEYYIYVDDEEIATLINSNGLFKLNRDIEYILRDEEKIEIEIRNENEEVIDTQRVVLFDKNEQFILFDIDGNIYENSNKKLSLNKRYNILFDNSLTSKTKDEIELNDILSLIENISMDNNPSLFFNDKEIFKANFTETLTIEPFLNALVIYVQNNYLETREVVSFNLKSFENDNLQELPEELEVLRWISNGVDFNFNNFSAQEELKNEYFINNRHYLTLKYKNNIYKRVVYSYFFQKVNSIKKFMINSNGTLENLKIDSINKRELEKLKLFFRKYSGFDEDNEYFFKTKNYVLKSVDFNRQNSLKDSILGYGESIFLADNLFNSKNESIVDFVYDNGYVKNYELTSNGLKVEFDDKIKELIDNLEMFVYQNEVINSYKLNDLNLNRDDIVFDFIKESDNFCIFFTLRSDFIGSIHPQNSIEFLNSIDLNSREFIQIFKFLRFAKFPFFRDENKKFIRRLFLNYSLELFEAFYEDSFKFKELNFEFNNWQFIIDDILFEIEIDNANEILNYVFRESLFTKLLKTPLFLLNLLSNSKNCRYIDYFITILDCEDDSIEERDETFIEKITNKTLDSFLYGTLTKSHLKHNIKIAFGYKNRDKYLNRTLYKLKRICKC